MTMKAPVESVDSPSTPALTASEIFPLLADDRRRNILHYLAQQTASVPFGELAEQLALWEDAPTYDQYERILTSFHHRHFPKLSDAGLIEYDIEREMVTGRSALDEVRPYLDLAITDDHC